MLHPRGPPAGDPATQTAGGLVRLSSVEAASAAIAALNERPSLTGPGGPPLLVSQRLSCSPKLLPWYPGWDMQTSAETAAMGGKQPFFDAIDSCLYSRVLCVNTNSPLALSPTPGNCMWHHTLATDVLAPVCAIAVCVIMQSGRCCRCYSDFGGSSSSLPQYSTRWGQYLRADMVRA